MGFDPCNRFLKIRESTETPTPNMGVHLGVWGFFPSHFFALPGAWNVTPDLVLARTLVSPCLGREPKAKVATLLMIWGGGIGRKKGNMYYIYFCPPNYYAIFYFPSVVTISLNFFKVGNKWNRVNKMRKYKQKATNNIQLHQIRT